MSRLNKPTKNGSSFCYSDGSSDDSGYGSGSGLSNGNGDG